MNADSVVDQSHVGHPDFLMSSHNTQPHIFTLVSCKMTAFIALLTYLTIDVSTSALNRVSYVVFKVLLGLRLATIMSRGDETCVLATSSN